MTGKTAQEFVEGMKRDGRFRCGVGNTGGEEELKAKLAGAGFCFGQRELVEAMAACMQEMEQMGRECCGRSDAAATGEEGGGAVAASSFRDLVPIAVVAAFGCVPCTEKTVARALDRGSRPGDIRRTLALAEKIGRQGCLADAVGVEGVSRMWEPLAAGRRVLRSRVTGEG